MLVLKRLDVEHLGGGTVPYFQSIIAWPYQLDCRRLISRLPPAATFGRGRLRDPDVLLPPKREKSHGRGSATRNSSQSRNQLLAAMSAADFALLQPDLKPMAMALLKDMEQPNQRIETVYFMETGIASVVAVQPDETRVEVGLIGREGMTGMAVVLGGNQSPHATYIQVAGEGQRIPAKELRKAMNASQTLHSLLLKFVQVFMVQTAHTAIANARGHIDQRLARWILMAHDRTGDNTLPLTHEFLSLMLGVRRAGVTEALQSLKRQKLIENGRNKIVIRNRRALSGWRGQPTARPKRNTGGLLERLSVARRM